MGGVIYIYKTFYGRSGEGVRLEVGGLSHSLSLFCMGETIKWAGLFIFTAARGECEVGGVIHVHSTFYGHSCEVVECEVGGVIYFHST